MKLSKNKIFIIAEAGVNHNGSIRKALKMVEVAKNSGADAIKFQTFIPNISHNKFYIEKKFLKESKKLSFSESQFKKIKKYCDKKKIEFMSTPFDIQSVNMLKKIGVRRFKISSANIKNIPLLKEISSLKKKIILSTGMATEKDISTALKILRKNKVTLLHCVSIYPTKNHLINLSRIKSLKKKFKLPVGFSDHTVGIGAAISSVNFGVSVLEKHFKLNNFEDCPDFLLSVTPENLKVMIDSVREAEVACGDGKILPGKEELKRKKRKILGVYYRISKKSGSRLLPEDIILQNPPTKHNFDQVKRFFNKKFIKNVKKGRPLSLSAIR